MALYTFYEFSSFLANKLTVHIAKSIVFIIKLKGVRNEKIDRKLGRVEKGWGLAPSGKRFNWAGPTLERI